ncbi:MAG: acyltransferase [Oscillospiraceae bacterium]|nr:acyltransferase [Oscillospiraceae bacterium]MBQ7129767.1 acyltransferase [Oscillospiraceae bacterium]
MPTNSLKPPARLTHIDLLECIGIYFVLFFHGSLYTYDYIMKSDLGTYLTVFPRSLLATCVPIFFFCNGYLLFGRPLDVKKHVKRMIRMVFLSFFWGSVLTLIMQPVFGERLTWESFWYKLTNWEWANQIWYMGALIGVHVFFPLMKAAYDHDKKAFYCFVAVCAFLTMGNTLINQIRTLLCRFLLQERMVYAGHNFNIFNPFQKIAGYAFVYFCMGGIMLSVQEKIEAVPARKRNCIALVVLTVSTVIQGVMYILFSRMLQQLWDVVWKGYDTVFTLVNVLCLFVLCLNWKQDRPLIRTISANTLGIYLLHVIPTWTLSSRAVQVPFLASVPGSAVFSLAVLLMTLGLCLILKRIPLIRKLL